MHCECPRSSSGLQVCPFLIESFVPVGLDSATLQQQNLQNIPGCDNRGVRLTCSVRPRQGGGGAAPAFHSQEALPSGGPEGSAPAFKRSSPGVTRATFTHSSLARVSPVTSQKDKGSSKCSTAMYPRSTELGNVGEGRAGFSSLQTACPRPTGPCAGMQAESLSRVRLLVTPCAVPRQAPLSLRFPRREYWSG